MAENVEPLEDDLEDGGDEGKRQRSAIAFPYTDFENAAKVASAIHGNVGHAECSAVQLATWMQVSPKSSGFRAQLAAARLFGLIESDSPDNIRLTGLGGRVLDAVHARSAKVEAFLRVPLFKALYEKYKDGRQTPPPAAMEREIVQLGVGEKQKARARQVFEGSAQQTGFREAAPNRLVMPAIGVKPPADDNKGKKDGGGVGGGSGGGEGLDLDPLIMALLKKIPRGDAGWPAENRLRWFKTLAMNVSQVYDADGEPVELEIKLNNGKSAN